MKNKTNKKFGRLVVVSLLVILLTMSAAQAMVKIDIKNMKKTIKIMPPPPKAPLDDNYFTWEDLFNDATKIDPTGGMSYNYDVTGGFVKMKNTYALWTDPAWTRMKPITITANQALSNYAIHLTINYDSDMRSDYGDIRFKHESSGDVLLNYWVESYDNSSASVWVKIPYLPTGPSTMYFFYGNPDAQSQSDFYSVFTDWQEHWPNDEQISYHGTTEGAWDPDVAYGNGEFLVSWEEGTTVIIKQEIRASMYNSDGTRVVFDKLIFSDGTTYYRNENPSIDYGGGKYFVAWQHYDNTYYGVTHASTEDIKARTVVRNGDQLTLGSVIDVCSASDCQADANVQYDSVNNRFCVVWEDARLGESNYNIYGRLYDTNGNPVGGEKNICIAANSQCEPWVAFNPNGNNGNGQYMIVWEDGITANNGPFSLKAGLFDANLNQIGNTITIATGSDSVDYNFPCVEFSEPTQRFLVTWNQDDISSGDWWGNVWGKIYDDAGNVVVDTFLIKSGEYVRTDIVPYLSSSFFVSFNSKSPGSGSGLIWGKLVSFTGEVFTDDVQLSASTSAEADWANMAVGNGKIFVTWEDERIMTYPDPDAFGNIWNLNIPSGSEVTYNIQDEKELILQAQLTSIPIDPENLLAWHDFNAISEGTITFDILDGTGNTILIQGISPGQTLQSLDPVAIRLRAHFTRSNPSYTPTLDSWLVRYIGQDLVPPVTELDHIVGTQGLNGWYTSEGVTVWLKSYDLPEGTGSGVNHTYYTLNGGSTQEYIVGSGIPLVVTQEMHKKGTWNVTFWSVDRSGNIEDKTQPDNTIQIKIDAERPYVVITEPADEQQVQVPFWVRANASDNAAVAYVEFDIEPFGQNPGLPYRVYAPGPYEWLCTIGEINTNKMIRAQVYDYSGQTWIAEHWIHIPISIDSSSDVSISASSQQVYQIPGSQQQGSTHVGSMHMSYTLIQQLLGLK